MDKNTPTPILYFLFAIIFQYFSGITGARINLTHIDSHGSYSKSELIHHGVDRSVLRHESIRSTLAQSLTNPDIQMPPNLFSSPYLMGLYIGTPPASIEVTVDTGSYLSWTHCKPCVNCSDPIDLTFDPTRSRSFYELPCCSSDCSLLPSHICNSDYVCQYLYQYADNTSTTGFLSTETFRFGNSKGEWVVPDVVFGCSPESSRSFDHVSGIVGLSMGPFSLVNYLDMPRFSYCLAQYLYSTTNVLLLGSSACLHSTNTLSTPIIKNPSILSLYYINLKGISIGGDLLQIPTEAFDIRSDGSGGTVIDSGTTFTGLISSAYMVVRKQVCSILNLPVSTQTIHPALNLCFQIEFKSMPDMPDMTLHLDGGDYVLPKERYMLFDRGFKLLCLGIVELPSMSIFGAYQQGNVHVLYDIGNMMLTFEETDECSSLPGLQCSGTASTGTVAYDSFTSSPTLFFIILVLFVAFIFI